MIKRKDNIDLVLECIPPTCYASIGAVIYTNTNLQINVIIGKIQNDWGTLTSKCDSDILHKHGRKCRIYTMIYAFGFFGNLIIYLLAHLIPLTIKLIKNTDEPKPLLFLLELGVDSEKYYYWILLYGHLTGFVCAVVIVNGDNILFMFLGHACGIFEIIGHKLTTAINENPDFSNYGMLRQKVQREIKICVTMHRRVSLFSSCLRDLPCFEELLGKEGYELTPYASIRLLKVLLIVEQYR
ncbi:uncharacterized protein LOC122500430 [Leptopilina heterotoma]|uniref:uncharacterized protein LOC122500430 n=1 Tax=Leptopilina heterotoma TaxID=63436 RepID=UPI001CA7CBE6|nr:uncharacterized protein LOC122500430 [Leptopilina heterotoma]